MSETNQFITKAVEMQQNALERSQQAFEDAVEIPLQQSVQFQRGAAELFLTGLETANWAQNRSVKLTRDAFDTYLDQVDDAAREASQLTEQRLSEATSLGQRGVASQHRQFSTGSQAGAEYGPWPPDRQAVQPSPQMPPQQSYAQQPARQPVAAQPRPAPQSGAAQQAPAGQWQTPPDEAADRPQSQPGQSAAGPQSPPTGPASAGPTPASDQPVAQPPGRPAQAPPQSTPDTPPAQGATPPQAGNAGPPSDGEPGSAETPTDNA